MEEDLINTTVRLKDDAAWVESATATGWPKIYGTVIDQTDVKARVRWTSGGTDWIAKRDLDIV